MIKFLAVIRSNGKGSVLNVADGQLHGIVAQERAAGSTVIGEYADKRHADRAVELGLRGWRRVEERKQA